MIPKPFATPRIPHSPAAWTNLWGKGLVICHLRFLKELSERRRGISPSCPPDVFGLRLNPVLFRLRADEDKLTFRKRRVPCRACALPSSVPSFLCNLQRLKRLLVAALVRTDFFHDTTVTLQDRPVVRFPVDVHTNCEQSTGPTGNGSMQQMQPKAARTTCQSTSEARPANEPCIGQTAR